MKALDAFNAWFMSAAGVLQTAILTLLLAFFDASGLDHDHSGYWLLWALTVYSAITQPALAYSGAVNARKTDALLERMVGLEDQNAQLLQRLDEYLETPPQ
jgi:hypothetical protein